MSEEKTHTKMEVLMFKASLHRGLKDVEEGTGIPYPTLININRGHQMVKSKKLKYTAHRGTRMILEDFFGVPWEDIFEDTSGEPEPAKSDSSAEQAISDTFTIEKKKK